MERFSGFPLDELIINKTPAFYTCPDDRKRVELIYDQLFSQVEPIEFWIVTKSGERKYLQNSFHRLSTNNDVFFVVTLDITIRKHTITNLEKRTTEFRTLADNSPEFIMRFNREFLCTYANPAVEPITGLSPAELQGKNVQSLGFDDHTVTLLRKSFIECFSERKKRNLEYKYDSPKGTRTVETIMVPEISQDSNTVQSVLTISRDVSAQKRMIDQIADSEKHYRLLANNSTDIIWTMNLKREITYVSPALERVLGYHTDEFSTPMFESSYTKETFESLQIVINEIIKHIKLGEYEKIRKDYRLEVQQYHKNRTLRFIEINMNARTDEFGKYVGIIGVSRDVSSRKEAELELIATREKALEADRLKTAFLANMSHEIRTPMNGIIGFVDLLAEEGLEPEQRTEYLELINANTNQLLKLIDDIIDISRIEAGQLTIKNHKVNIVQLLNDVVKTHREKLRHSSKENLEILLKAEHNELIMDVDPIRLTQIVSNLVGNSAKFTDKGSITVSYSKKSNSEIQLCVADTGIGLTQEKIDYIFDRFRQADEQDSRKYGGAGLGLSIAKNLVELMNGKIWAESNENKGASFFFTLPHEWEVVLEDTHVLTTVPETESEIVIKNIMVVEDEEMNFMLIRETLKDEPYRLFWAHDGTEALEIIKEELIDLILMDIRLPKLNGYETTKQIKANLPHIPIIAQTAYSNYSDVVTALESGCDDFIAKPIKPKKLKSLIEKYLSGNGDDNEE
jgi:PAS domain S-box-containing protein